VHVARQHVCDDDVIGVGTVVHEIDDDVVPGDLLKRALVLIIDAGLVKQIDDDLRDVIADLVVRQHVEVRDDFVEVLPDLAPHGGLRQSMLRHMRPHRRGDDGIVGERAAGEARLLQLITAEPSF